MYSFGRLRHWHLQAVILRLISCNPKSEKDDSPLPNTDYHTMYVLLVAFYFSAQSRVCLAFYLLCLTRVVRTPFRSLHVSSGRPALSLPSQLAQAELS